ncbi:M23 family peptidase, partial [Chroococcidiopsidales cyanobacterium LEGE 13417]|nr:M23 family peptidase [Chroococcidiopsidales cyanobacterium LEGE 13417]
MNQLTGSREQRAGSREPESKGQGRQGSGQPTTSYQLPTTNYQLPILHCFLLSLGIALVSALPAKALQVRVAPTKPHLGDTLSVVVRPNNPDVNVS